MATEEVEVDTPGEKSHFSEPSRGEYALEVYPIAALRASIAVMVHEGLLSRRREALSLGRGAWEQHCLGTALWGWLTSDLFFEEKRSVEPRRSLDILRVLIFSVVFLFANLRALYRVDMFDEIYIVLIGTLLDCQAVRFRKP
jgi:hypothetical protein